MKKKIKVSKLKLVLLLVAATFMSGIASHAQNKKPNILVIFGDDVGQTNISAYSF